jgi:hypothetical protein
MRLGQQGSRGSKAFDPSPRVSDATQVTSPRLSGAVSGRASHADCAGLVQARAKALQAQSSSSRELPVWHKNLGELSVYRKNATDSEWATRMDRIPAHLKEPRRTSKEAPLAIPTGRTSYLDQDRSTCLAKSKDTRDRLAFGGKEAQSVVVLARRSSKLTAEHHQGLKPAEKLFKGRASEMASPISKIALGSPRAERAANGNGAGPPDPAVWPFLRESHHGQREIVPRRGHHPTPRGEIAPP